jgi:hypothetical protein
MFAGRCGLINSFSFDVVSMMKLLGVIAESVPKRTLSGSEERGARISQGPEPILERFGRPDVVAIEADVFQPSGLMWASSASGRVSPWARSSATA